jgi:UDPglucose 6-dehydrogenase
MQSANALILCTEWHEFQNPEIKKLNSLKDKKIFDGRNFLNKEVIVKAGIEYFGLGK